MTDTTLPTGPSIMKGGLGKVASGILAAGLSSYIINQFSLHGINFELAMDAVPGVKVSSEFVKSSLEGTLVGFFVWVTPAHIVQLVKDGIIFVRTTLKTWGDAWRGQ